MMQRLFAPRGVLDTRASETDDPTEDERFGRVGRQTITDTGPLTRKRMETIEDRPAARGQLHRVPTTPGTAPASTPKQWSKRCSRPPPSAKETSNGGRQGMIDDMLAGSSRR